MSLAEGLTVTEDGLVMVWHIPSIPHSDPVCAEVERALIEFWSGPLFEPVSLFWVDPALSAWENEGGAL